MNAQISSNRYTHRTSRNDSYVSRSRRARRKAFRRLYRRAIVASAAVVLLVLCVWIAAKSNGKAVGKSERVKQLTSVCVEEGDCIWTIAKQYYTEECGSMQDYVSEIKKTNNLYGDRILSGYSLLIPYYE